MERLAGKVILLWGWRRAVTAFIAGALAVLSQPPFDFFAVCFVSFPLLVWLLDGADGLPEAGFLRRLAPAFAVGWWFGFGYFVAGLWWIGNALLVDAENFAWALPLAVLALPAALALFHGLAAALARSIWSDGIGRIAALAFAFGIAEWLRAVAFTGFPWNAIGYAAMPVPVLMQSSAVVGLFGMNALAVFVFAMPALFAARRHLGAGLALTLLLATAHAGFGFSRLAGADAALADARDLPVRVVQPSIAQTQKWDASIRDEILKTYLDLSRLPPAEGVEKPDLLVWPETALPFLVTQNPDALAAIGDLLDEGQLLLAGAVRVEGGAVGSADARYYNSIVAINDVGAVAAAIDKMHLVPFGEYVPFERFLSRLGVEKLVALPGGFSAGSGGQVLQLPGGLSALGLICYEAIFPGAITAEAGVDLLLNVTNDAWFGDTPGPHQHFRQAQLRAVETGLPMIRAANNGISAVIDSYGRIVDALALNAVGALDASVPLARRGSLAASSRMGIALGIIAMFGIAAAVFAIAERRRFSGAGL